MYLIEKYQKKHRQKITFLFLYCSLLPHLHTEENSTLYPETNKSFIHLIPFS